MNIAAIGGNSIKINQNNFQNTNPAGGTDTSFGNVLQGYLNNVDSTVKQSADLNTQAAAGNVNNIQDVTIASEKAKLALELTVGIRDKAVEAYQNIMQMQF